MKEILEARTEIQHALPITTTSVVEMATPNVLDLAIESGYSGTAWLEIQRRLVVRAFPDLERAIVRGRYIAGVLAPVSGSGHGKSCNSTHIRRTLPPRR
jgi:hypothetical protein